MICRWAYFLAIGGVLAIPAAPAGADDSPNEAESPRSKAGSVAVTADSDRPEPPPLPGPAEPLPSADDIQRWISGLGDDRFEVRQTATRELERAGVAAVLPLSEAAQGANLEVTCRAIRVLAAIADRGDPDTFEKAQIEIERLSASKSRSAARRAQLALQGLAGGRRKHAIARLLALGAIIKRQVLPRGVIALDEEESEAQQVVLNRRWKGGDEGLVYLRRIPELRQLYVIKGAAVSTEALDSLKRDLQNNLMIQFRGEAMLGVSTESDGTGGIRVSTVAAGSAAERCGLREGDLIIKYDGQELTKPEKLIEITGSHRAGDAIVLEILRDGKLLKLDAVLGEWQ